MHPCLGREELSTWTAMIRAHSSSRCLSRLDHLFCDSGASSEPGTSWTSYLPIYYWYLPTQPSISSSQVIQSPFSLDLFCRYNRARAEELVVSRAQATPSPFCVSAAGGLEPDLQRFHLWGFAQERVTNSEVWIFCPSEHAVPFLLSHQPPLR
jgi:hypothetical protein